MKHSKRNSIIILIFTVFLLWYLLKDSYVDIVNTLSNANFLILILVFIAYIFYFMFDQAAFYIITKQYKKDVKMRYIIYLGLITKFFNGITPLASGGQPFQVYDLHKNGLSIAQGTNVVIQNYFVFQNALVLHGVISIILNQIFHYFEYIPLLRWLTIIGFVINIIILLVLLMISFSASFNKKVVNFIINLLYKIHIVKNKEEQISKWDKVCNDYYQNAQVLLKNKSILYKGIIYQYLSLTVYFILPLILAYSINISENLNIINTIVASAYIYIMGCYVPIPGATGGMELGFMGFFGNFISDVPLKALLIIWRFATYYLPTIVGGIVLNINYDKKEKKEFIK